MKPSDEKSSKPKGRRSQGRQPNPKPAGADRLVVRKWGNSAGLRIPMNIMRAAKLEMDQEVDAHVEDGKLIVQPVTGRKKYVLKDLLAALTPENRHEFSEDKPAGKEFW